VTVFRRNCGWSVERLTLLKYELVTRQLQAVSTLYVFLTLPYPLLTTSDRFHVEEPTVPQPFKQFPALYGTWKFFTRHLTLSWARSNQSKPSQPICWTPVLILSSHLRLGLPSCLFPLAFRTKNPIRTSSIPHSCHMPYPSLSFWFDHPDNMLWWCHVMKLLIMTFPSVPCFLIPLSPDCLSQHPVLDHP
jgi:hypothetical protein